MTDLFQKKGVHIYAGKKTTLYFRIRHADMSPTRVLEGPCF